LTDAAGALLGGGNEAIVDLGANPPTEGWSENIHNKAGNLGLGDGSAQQVSVAALQKQITSAIQGGGGTGANIAGYGNRVKVQVPKN